MKRKPSCKTFIFVVLLFILSAAGSLTDSIAEQYACTTSECHQKIDDHNYVHGPIAVGECLICHGQLSGHIKDPENNRYKPVTDSTGKCYICHETSHIETSSKKKIQGKECTSCHNPHGAAQPLLLDQ